jgi:hypothetical protein
MFEYIHVKMSWKKKFECKNQLYNQKLQFIVLSRINSEGRINFIFEKPNKRESIIATPKLKPNIHFESTTEVENGDSSIAGFKDENWFERKYN